MLFFSHVKQFWKFTIFSCIATGLLMVVVVVSYIGLKEIKQRFDYFTDQYQALALTISDMHTQGVQTEQAVRNVILNPSDEKALANYKKASDEFLRLHKEATTIAKKMNGYDKKLGEFPKLWQASTAIKENIIALAKAGNQSGAVEILVKQETPLWRDTKNKIIDIQTQLKKEMQVEHKSLSDYTGQIFIEIMIVLGLAVVLINVFILVLWRLMQKPMDDMICRLKDIAVGDGDLTLRLEVCGKDEFAEAAHWLNQFMEKLNLTLTRISGTTTTLATAASQLKSTAEQIATGAEEVAAQSGTIATAGEEMTATSGDIAQNCQLAAEGAKMAREAAVSGSQVVDETITVMDNIAERVKNSAKGSREPRQPFRPYWRDRWHHRGYCRPD